MSTAQIIIIVVLAIAILGVITYGIIRSIRNNKSTQKPPPPPVTNTGGGTTTTNTGGGTTPTNTAPGYCLVTDGYGYIDNDFWNRLNKEMVLSVNSGSTREIAALQRLLRHIYPKDQVPAQVCIPVDGSFGPKTQAAVQYVTGSFLGRPQSAITLQKVMDIFGIGNLSSYINYPR